MESCTIVNKYCIQTAVHNQLQSTIMSPSMIKKKKKKKKKTLLQSLCLRNP